MKNQFDNGVLRVTVPDGWAIFRGIDSSCEITRKKVHIFKNAVQETDIFTRAGITVCFYGEEDYFLSPRFFYDDAADLEPFALGMHTWTGYTCTSLGYPYTMLESRQNGCIFYVMILMENGEHRISLDDADVQTVLKSIAQTEKHSGDTV